MIDLPKELAPLRLLRVGFSGENQERFVVLTLGAIIAMGRRTVSRVLWAVSCLCSGHPCGYHRFFSSARWSLWTLARVLAAMVLELSDPQQPVVLIVEDTVVGHRGNKVFGKGWHRDAVNSSHGHLSKKLGRQAGKANPTMRPKGKKGAVGKKQSRSKLPVLRKRNEAGVLEPRYKARVCWPPRCLG